MPRACADGIILALKQNDQDNRATMNITPTIDNILKNHARPGLLNVS